MTGIVRTVLHAIHAVFVRRFFNVHCGHDQNSPFLSVISSIAEILLSFDPPQTTHAIDFDVLTRVHLRHVHSSCSTDSWSSVEIIRMICDYLLVSTMNVMRFLVSMLTSIFLSFYLRDYAESQRCVE